MSREMVLTKLRGLVNDIEGQAPDGYEFDHIRAGAILDDLRLVLSQQHQCQNKVWVGDPSECNPPEAAIERPR